MSIHIKQALSVARNTGRWCRAIVQLEDDTVVNCYGAERCWYQKTGESLVRLSAEEVDRLIQLLDELEHSLLKRFSSLS